MVQSVCLWSHNPHRNKMCHCELSYHKLHLSCTPDCFFCVVVIVKESLVFLTFDFTLNAIFKLFLQIKSLFFFF